jgi:hypothetical protein
VPPRPDPQSFTKFLLSAGVFLVIAAFVLPGLILRDTGVLEISRRELLGSSPVAKEELERRQRVSRDVGRAAPFLGGAAFIAGALLIGFCLPRLRRQEEQDDERSAMEMDKLRLDLEPQSDADKEERLRTEIVEDRKAAEESAELRPPGDSSTLPSAGEMRTEEGGPPGYGEMDPAAEVMERAGLERRVLERLAELAPPLFELQAQVKVAGAPRLLLDGLLVSRVDQTPDVVVEIKFTNRFVPSNIGNRLAETVSRLLRYRARFNRPAVAWLILLADGPITDRLRRRVEEAASEFGDEVRVSLVTPESIGELALPS